MDLKKIFIKDACPTKVGGQAVLDGIMMKGKERTAIAMRLSDHRMYIKTEKTPEPGKLTKIPLLRGVVVFVDALVQGTKTLMYSADVLEKSEGEDGGSEENDEEDKFFLWLEKHLGEKRAWTVMLYFSVILALILTIAVFIVLPTIAVNLLKIVTENQVILNLSEGFLRIILFVLYVMAVSRMEEIKKVFQFHGAEHKCIHCYENGRPLTPENCREFYTLHPRCGTSFLMFVMVISLVLFSLLGWPNLIWRVLSRLLLLPVVAGLSYELLRWAGKSDNIVVKILSLPGLWLQKLTTREPTEDQLEVAIAAMEAVLAEKGDYGEGFCDAMGRIKRSGGSGKFAAPAWRNSVAGPPIY